MQMIKGGDGVSISCSIIENTIRKPNLNLVGGVSYQGQYCITFPCIVFNFSSSLILCNVSSS